MSYTETVLETAGLVGFWEGGSEAGSTEKDLSGIHDAEWVGSPERHTAPILSSGEGYSFKVLGENQYIDAGTGHNEAGTGIYDWGDTFSLEIWIQRSELSTASQPLIGKGTNGGLIELQEGSGNLVFYAGNTTPVAKATAACPSAGKPYHVVATKNGEARHIYVNGVDVTELLTNQTPVNNTRHLCLAHFDGYGTRWPRCYLQYGAAYNVALTKETVQAHYQAGLPEPEPPRYCRPSPPPTRLAIRVDPYDGDSITLGPDELAGFRSTSISFGTELPGGFGAGNFTVPVLLGTEEPYGWFLAPLKVYDADTDQPFYEGRITGVVVQGSAMQITTEGWAKHLADNELARETFIDRELSSWLPTSAGRKAAVGTSYNQETAPEIIPDPVSRAPYLKLTSQGKLKKPIWDTYYDIGPGKKAARILVTVGLVNILAHGSDANTGCVLCTDSIDSFATFSNEGDISSAGAHDVTFSKPNRMVLIAGSYNSEEAGSAGSEYGFHYSALAIIGSHGLTLRGSGTEAGFYVSDMVGYTLSRFAPLLKYTTGENGSVRTTTFVVPHMAFREDTTAQAMIEQMTVLGGSSKNALDWGVYDNRTFFLKEPGTYGTTWRVRKDEGAESLSDGPDVSQRINGIKVLFDAGGGIPSSVGPPNSGAHSENALLQDTNPSNPANMDGAQHWRTFDAGICTEAGAILIGQLILARASELCWRGTVNVKGMIKEDRTGAEYPAAYLRSGDYIVVEDDEDTRPRRVINTSYDNASGANSASCGAPPDYLDVLLANRDLALAAGNFSG